MELVFRFNKNVVDSPAFFLVCEGMAAMNRAKTLPRQDNQLDLGDAGIAYAVAGKDIIGVVCMRPAKNVNTLNILLGYVAPDQRRKGVFTRLLREVEEHAKKKGYRCLSVIAESTNGNALDLLDKSGFGDVAVVMEKRLL